MPSCFVPGCTTGNGRGHHGPVHLFKFPRKATADTKMNWESNIPKREDRKWNFSSSQLCHLHFEDKFIEKTKRVMMGSVVMAEEPRKQWTLTTDAVPTIFSNRNVPKYFDKKVASRRPPKDRTTSPPIPDDVPVAITEVEVSTSASTSDEVACVNLHRALRQTPLPPNWILQNLENSVRICYVLEDKTCTGLTFHVEKFIEVFENQTYEVRIRGKAVTGQFENSMIKSTLDLQNMISQLTQMGLCPGAQNCNMFKKWPSAHKVLNVWYSEECEQSTLDNTPCLKCSELKSTLVKAAEYALKKKQNASADRMSIKLALKRKKNKASRLKTWRLHKKNSELKSLQKKFLKNSETHLEKGITELQNIPEPLKLAMITAVRNAKAKSKTGKRYAADWLMYALLLKVKSPKGYRHARDTNMIPLPSPAHLSRLIRGIPCQFGFSDFVFMALEKQYKHKLRRDRQFVLLFDEMKVKEAIAFDKTSMKFMGFIDYGEFSSDYKAKKGSKKEADHCLVFMARCVNSSMTQPIAAFATRGAAPGNVLAKMILSCIVRLEAVNCEVIGVTCDGATTNKSAWKFLGISGENGHVINKIVNPVMKIEMYIFFLNIPHIIKCIRNHLHKQGEAKVLQYL
ncbi:Transposable element P transposase [Orchesella cincta]|uniref:Transposable element P transposase n=1 Tax=Orchesella cincta TaxID=48709 RepID=A0A1D2M2X8_ORCCI|nr:Transposable element P transposase [Orchesella cincta]